MTIRRSKLIKSFIGSNIVALGAGTPYIYSYYAPQLLARCKIPMEQSSNVALSINLGSSLLGMVAGMIVDTNPKLSSLVGSLCQLLAYVLLYVCYNHAISNIFFLILALISLGFGSVCAFYGAMKVCTVNFPNHRGTAGACPVSLYGLSGLFFSTLCTHLFGNNMSNVFLFLLIVCPSTAIIGTFTMEYVDEVIKEKDMYTSLESHSQFILTNNPSTDDIININSNDIQNGNHELPPNDISQRYIVNNTLQSAVSNAHSRNMLLTNISPRISNSESREGSITSPKTSTNKFSSLRNEYDSINEDDTIPASATMDDINISKTINEAPIDDYISIESDYSDLKDLTIWESVKTSKFILYYIIVALLQGIGQSYIYSIGFIVQAQFNSNIGDNVDSENTIKKNAAKIQAAQVAIISISSFFGRITSGPFSDILVKKYRSQRIWTIFGSACFVIIGTYRILYLQQQDVVNNNTSNIYASSVIFGYAFGSLFGTFPSIVADTFGTKTFSTLWGLSTTGGLIVIKFITSTLAKNLSDMTTEGEQVCSAGVLCFTHTFIVIRFCAVLAIVLITVVITMTYRKQKAR